MGKYYFKNIDDHKKYLTLCFEELNKLSTDDLIHYCKYKEICELKYNKKFENKIFLPDNWDNFNIKPILEFCENNNQFSLYNYLRKVTSSLPTTGVIGRSIRILVKDDISKQYIGLMCLSSDVYTLGDRDQFIGLTKENKEKYLKNIMNLSCCVPLQPFGFNTNGGKLIASLAFSKEVFDYYYSKYNEPLLGIVTTSINGKSIQYDRNKYLKLIGFTKGFGTVYFPTELYRVCKEYNSVWKIITEFDRVDKFNLLQKLLSHLNISKNILFHGKKRGIYFGYLFSTKLNENFNKNELDSIDNIYEEWKNRWCNNRIKNLLNNLRLKNTIDVYSIEKFNDIEFKHYQLPKLEYKNIDDDLIKEILLYKNKKLTLQKVCENINKNLPFNLSINDISRIFTGKLKPKIIDNEYLGLFNEIKSPEKVIHANANTNAHAPVIKNK